MRHLAIACAVILSMIPGVLSAQVGGSIEAALTCFETSVSEGSSTCTESKSVAYYLLYGDDSEVQTAMDGLERIALTAQSLKVRMAAVIALGQPGQAENGGHTSGLPRLVRVYRETIDDGVRFSIIGQIPRQVDSGAAATFLAEVATEAPDPRYTDRSLQRSAVENLAVMGASGVRVLQALSADDRVRDPAARARLNMLEAQGWIIPTGEN